MTIISKPIEGLCCDASTLPHLGISIYTVSDIKGIHEYTDVLYGDHTSQHAKLIAIQAGMDLAIGSENKIIWTNSDCCVKWINNGNISASVKNRDEIIELTSIISRFCKEHDIEVKFWSARIWGKIPGHLTKGSKKSALADNRLTAEPETVYLTESNVYNDEY